MDNKNYNMLSTEGYLKKQELMLPTDVVKDKIINAMEEYAEVNAIQYSQYYYTTLCFLKKTPMTYKEWLNKIKK